MTRWFALLEFVGHTVIRENHVGDWGTPFGMLIEHLLDLQETDAAAGFSVGDLDAFYKAGQGEVRRQRRRSRIGRAIESCCCRAVIPRRLRLWKLLVDLSMHHFNELYRKIGVLLTDDDLAGESSYNDLLPEVVERLRTAGLLQQSDGADVVFPPGYTNRDGDPLPLIVQKRGGGFNYGTSDLACVLDRVERVKATLLLYVVGAPQAQHLSMVFDVAAMAGWLRPPARAVHVAFGNVLGSDRKMLKSRSGEPVRFVDVVDEAIERATAAVLEKNPDLPSAERTEIGRKVGVGALKYADLSTDRIKDYVFDWDRMLAFEGNTAPYLQYAHARIRSILRKGGDDTASPTEAADAARRARARSDPATAAVRCRRAGHARQVQPASVVHLPLRTGTGLHVVLRGLPGAESRRGDPAAAPPTVRADSADPRQGPRSARHRGAGAHVMVRDAVAARIEAPERM